VTMRAVSPANGFFPASMKSLDHFPQICFYSGIAQQCYPHRANHLKRS
jgi:hypothetical protein